mmetsp:Transcript_28830/g.73885  ORF Transcript_28830/g.73885 Transcript_28830/m.73885 type:complete len:195 (-) Transcript_28830:3645-4229(-)
MGLLSILKKVKRKEKEMRILVVGLDNAGKTTLVKRLAGEDISEIAPTFGFNIKTLHYSPQGSNQEYKLNMWDVGGQKTLRAYWRNYFEATEALIWVVDSADIARLNDCKEELQNLLKEERLSGSTLLILANKQDLPGALGTKAITEKLGLADGLLGKRHWSVAAVSAMDESATALRHSIDWLVKDIASRVFLLD